MTTKIPNFRQIYQSDAKYSQRPNKYQHFPLQGRSKVYPNLSRKYTIKNLPKFDLKIYHLATLRRNPAKAPNTSKVGRLSWRTSNGATFLTAVQNALAYLARKPQN
jgi:hypothetical protein